MGKKGWWRPMIQSMLEIFIIAFAVSFATNFLRRKILTPEDMAKMMESQKFKRTLLEAQRKGDKKTLQRLMKKQEYYRKIDAEVGKKNFLILLVSITIFYLVFLGILTPVYGGLEAVALLPGDMMIPLISSGNKLTSLGWYILSLFAVGFPLGKLFEVKPKAEKPAEAQEK